MAGLFGALAGYLLEARFYKWYIWLFPLGTVWLLDRVSGCSPRARRRWIATTGFWVGLGWLFRWDVGTTGAAACVVYLFLVHGGNTAVKRANWRDYTAFGSAFVLLPLAWFGYLLCARGPAGPRFYVWTSLKGAVNLSRAMAIPLPGYSAADPLSPASVLVLGYAVVIATYTACGLIGVIAEWRGRSNGRSRLLLAVALVGLSTFHQGIYRKGAFHLVQIIPPVIIGSCVLMSVLFEYLESIAHTGLRNRAVRFLGLALLVGTAIAGLGLVTAGRSDLSPFTLRPRQKLRGLAHPLDSRIQGVPALAALRAVREATNRDDPILVFPVDSQYLAFLNRPVSGRLTVFVPGFFDEGVEVERNLDAIRKSMPKVVIVAPGIAGGDAAGLSAFHRDSARAHAYVIDFIRENYTKKLHECDRCIVLARGEGSANPVTSLERNDREVARGQRNDAAPYRR